MFDQCVNFEFPWDPHFNPNLPSDFSPNYYHVTMDTLVMETAIGSSIERNVDGMILTGVEDNMIQKYPNCTVNNLCSIGVGICDVGEYNTKECNYDLILI